MAPVLHSLYSSYDFAFPVLLCKEFYGTKKVQASSVPVLRDKTKLKQNKFREAHKAAGIMTDVAFMLRNTVHSNTTGLRYFTAASFYSDRQKNTK